MIPAREPHKQGLCRLESLAIAGTGTGSDDGFDGGFDDNFDDNFDAAASNPPSQTSNLLEWRVPTGTLVRSRAVQVKRGAKSQGCQDDLDAPCTIQ